MAYDIQTGLETNKPAMIYIKGKNINRLLEGPIGDIEPIAGIYKETGETIEQVITCQT